MRTSMRTRVISSSHSRESSDWKNRLDRMNIRSNLKNEIIQLAMDDADMRNAIGMDREYTKEVSFDYLENLGIKRSARERRRYNKLIKVLEKIKITLLIE